MHAFSYSQQGEVELKERADKLFEDEKYVEATPLYAQLVALNPRLHDYQFRFGTCLLYNSYKKQDAFKYLNYAVTDPATDVRAYYFLGKAYHLTYQFNEAIKNYELYKQKCGGKPRASYELDRQIEMCQNGKRLLTTISDLVVLEKKEYAAKDFFRLYKLQDIGGDIIVGADYQSKIDKKKGYIPIIHYPANASALYYASYGETDTGQKDIYVRKKLPNGSWGLPQPVAGTVNTPFDEDFPYMHPGGEYLYFCSKGHNSMGGYDIFRSKLNPDNGTFGPPENMDFAISSPDNDLFFVVDSLDNQAYFASSRQSSNGNVHVYRVRVDRVPLQLAVVKGSFASTIRPENKKISITVTDYASGEKIGSFVTNDKGGYLITFPKGGKYTYEMKVEGSTATHKYVVSIPFLKEFKPLKQKISEETLEGGEVVKVIDLFNEEVDDPMGVLAEVIKLRSELNPNADQFDLQELDEQKANAKVLEELGFADATPGAVISTFEQLQARQDEKVKTSDNLSKGALNQAAANLDEAARLQEAAKALVNQANAASGKEQKFAVLSDAQEKLQRSEALETEARTLLQFSDSVYNQSAKDREKLETLKAVTEEVRKDITAGNMNDLKEVVTGNASLIQAVNADKTTNPIDALTTEKSTVQKEKKALEQQKDNFERTENALEQELNQLKTDLEAAKAKDKPGIQSKIDSKTSELAMVEEQLGTLDKKIAKATEKERALDERIRFLQAITAVNSTQAVSAQQVQNQLAAVDSKNNNTLAAYVDQQVTALKKDPEIAGLQSPGKTDPVVDQLADRYEEQLESANASGEPAEQARKRLKVAQEITGAIDDALAGTEAELARDPENKAARERKEQLTVLKQQTEARIRQEEQQLAALPTNTGSDITAGQVQEQLSPNHEDRLKAVDGGSPEATRAAQNELDEQLVAKVNEELGTVNDQLRTDPNNKAASERKKALEAVKNTATSRIEERKAQLAALPSNAGSDITAGQVQEQLSPNHEDRLKAVDGGSPEATLAAQNELDEQLVAKVNEELGAVNDQLRTNPNNKAASERKQALEAVKNDAEERISDRNQLVATLRSDSGPEITAETELALLSPDHEQRLTAVKGSTPEATVAAQNALDNQLINQTDAALSQVNAQLRTNPQDQRASDRKTALEQVKSDAQERIRARNEQLVSQPATNEGPVSAEQELALLSPNHAAKLDAIDAGSEKATLQARNALDQELIDQVTGELEDVEGQLLRNPANATAKQRQEALNTVKSAAEERIDERNERLENLDRQPDQTTENPLAVVTRRVRPDHRDELSTIEASMEDGIQKDLALLKEENDLLSAIEKAVKQQTAALAKDPSNAALEKEVNTLREAATLQEALIREREQDLIAIERAKLDSKQLVKEVLPAYREPDMQQREAYSEAEVAGLTKQEQQLRDQLIRRLRANEKQLAKNFNPKLAAENKVITELMEQSVNREQQLNTPVTDNPLAAATIAEDLGQQHAFLMETNPASVDEAKRMLTALREYESNLEDQLQDERSANPQDATAIEQKEAQLRTVRKRIGVIEVDLDAMESRAILAENPENTAAENALKQLTATERELEKRLQDPGLTATEKRNTEKELAAVREQKATATSKALTAELTDAQQRRAAAEAQLDQVPANDPLVVAVKARNEALTSEQPIGKQPENLQLQNRIQNETRATQLAAATADLTAATATYEETGIVTATPAQLNEQKRRFSIEIGQLEAEIAAAQKDPKRRSELPRLQDQKAALEKAVATVTELETQLAREVVPQPGVKAGMETPVSYEEEVKLAGSPEYPALLQQQTAIQSTRGQLAALIREKAALREELAGAATEAARSRAIGELTRLTDREQELRTQLDQQETALQTALRQTETKAGFENLLAREVAPVKPVAVTTDLLPTLGDGFELVQQPGTVRTEKVLQVGTKPPSGLVYRVQVGAYAKPIPENLFKEFTPVTGEPLNNGITRYLAGYFGNRNRAIEAQGQIRGLGYADAFVVAYCDGNRITLAEARRLEDLGLCVPKNQDSLLLEVVENTLAQLPRDSAARLRPTPKPSDYNKAPGAAVADAAEEHPGLYYTVQVGVYNRPVPASQIKNIDPLVTKRLPNGQIRYSSGMFHSVAEARPKRTEAITRGITDAFITAYYKGERITIDEARRLLEENGVAILEPRTTVVPDNAMEQARAYAQTQPQPQQEKRVQFVSQEVYTTYPREAITQLNVYGSFYFDPADKRIKSVEYLPEEALSRTSALLKTMDTLQTVQPIFGKTEPTAPSVVAEWESTELSGALADWLLRSTQQRSGVRTETGFRIVFEAVGESERELLMLELTRYGARSVKVQEETETNNR